MCVYVSVIEGTGEREKKERKCETDALLPSSLDLAPCCASTGSAETVVRRRLPMYADTVQAAASANK